MRLILVAALLPALAASLKLAQPCTHEAQAAIDAQRARDNAEVAKDAAAQAHQVLRRSGEKAGEIHNALRDAKGALEDALENSEGLPKKSKHALKEALEDTQKMEVEMKALRQQVAAVGSKETVDFSKNIDEQLASLQGKLEKLEGPGGEKKVTLAVDMNKKALLQTEPKAVPQPAAPTTKGGAA